MAATATDTKPAYGGFQTFWNFILQLAEHGVPQRLDRSVMGSRGGSSRAELYIALRFFGLMHETKEPTGELYGLASDPTKDALRQLVERSYASVIALDLDTATPRQVDERLEALGATPSTVSRSRTFFLNAAEQAGIEVGRLLKTNRAPTSAPRRRSTKPKPRKQLPDERNNGVRSNKDLPDLVRALVGKLPSEAEGWEVTEAKAWLAMLPQALAFDYKLPLDQLEGSP